MKGWMNKVELGLNTRLKVLTVIPAHMTASNHMNSLVPGSLAARREAPITSARDRMQ